MNYLTGEYFGQRINLVSFFEWSLFIWTVKKIEMVRKGIYLVSKKLVSMKNFFGSVNFFTLDVLSHKFYKD